MGDERTVPKTQFAKLGNDRIAYQIVGDGPVDLLWVAGIGDPLDARWEYGPWASLLWRLASFSRLIMMDRRGMGASDPVPLEALPSWEEFVDDALAVLDAAQSDQTVLLASNDASATATLFAATRPERTRSLILFNPTINSLTWTADSSRLGPDDLEALRVSLEENWGTEEGAAMAVPEQSGDPVAMRFHAKNMRLSCSPKQAGAYIRQNAAVDIRDVLSSIAVPTLLLHRQEALFYSPIETSRHLADQIPDARLVMVPGNGLNIYAKPHSQILDEIEAFVTGISPAAATNRTLATILFTDIVGSTEHASALGDRRWRALLESHDAVARTVIDQHSGRLVRSTRSTGDGVLATFDGPGRAIRCAFALREALRPLNVKIRAGLHTGEVELREDDIGGIAVHVAARVLEQAEADELLTSSAVPLLVAGSGIEFEDRGEHELKGISGTVRLFAVQD
jgi:class 3 adenylate cyclase/pimeloyl-ACP methyl ester carboxylesterase